MLDNCRKKLLLLFFVVICYSEVSPRVETLSLLLIILSLCLAPACADIQKGASGDDVRAMQLRLQDLGYLKGDAVGSLLDADRKGAHRL